MCKNCRASEVTISGAVCLLFWRKSARVIFVLECFYADSQSRLMYRVAISVCLNVSRILIFCRTCDIDIFIGPEKLNVYTFSSIVLQFIAQFGTTVYETWPVVIFFSFLNYSIN